MLTTMRETNLCTYFLLPLLGLSEHSFGEGNFQNSFIHKDERSIYVSIHHLNLVPPSVRQGVTVVETGDCIYLRFTFPEMWYKDFDLFIEGKYSKMSLTAKQAIKSYSCLMYKVEMEGTVYTDFRITALERSPDLIEEWKTHLYGVRDVSVLDTDPTTELLEAPGDYMFFNKTIQSSVTL